MEISDALIDQQERLLCENPSTPVSDEAYVRKNHTRTGLPVYWYRDLDDVPAGVSIKARAKYLHKLVFYRTGHSPRFNGPYKIMG